MESSRPIFAALMALAFGTVPFDAAAQSQASESPGIVADLGVSKDRYLSTETIAASLVIANTSATTVSFNPGSVSFLIRHDDGTREERHWITVITRPIPDVAIGAGKTYWREIPLPPCEVLSDPCTQHVALALRVRTPAHATIDIVTPERTFVVEADPTATFGGFGISGNHPLLITQGEFDGPVRERLRQIVFRFAASAAGVEPVPDESAAVRAAFAARGLTATVGGSSVTPDGREVQIDVLDSIEVPSSDAAIGDVQKAFGTRVMLVSKTYVPSYYGGPNSGDIDAKARGVALAQAQLFSDAAGGGPVSQTETGFGFAWETRVLQNGIPSSAYVPSDVFAGAGPVPDRTSGAVAPELGVRVRETLVSTEPTVLNDVSRAPSSGEHEYSGSSPGDIEGLPIQAPIAGDRPEIYAIGEAAATYGPALTSALGRARAIGRMLGSFGGPVSMLAGYSPWSPSGLAGVAVMGAAIAPSGDIDRSWQQIEPGLEDKRAVLPTPSPAPSAASDSHGPLPKPLQRFIVPIVALAPQSLVVVRADVPGAAIRPWDDCDALVARAQRLSLTQALRMAVTRAHESGETLRHLVIVAAYPPSVNHADSCASKTGGSLAGVVAHAPIELTFRTR